MSYPVADNDISEIANTSASQLDVKKFIFKLVGFLPWIIISTLVSYSIATLYLRYTAQVHKISAQILIKDDQQSSPDYNIIRELGVMPELCCILQPSLCGVLQHSLGRKLRLGS